MYALAGTRIMLPQLPLAIVCLLIGATLIVLGVLCTRKVRAHLWSHNHSALDFVMNDSRPTHGYLLHHYDEPDKWLLVAGLIGKYPGGLLLIWGIAGIALRS